MSTDRQIRNVTSYELRIECRSLGKTESEMVKCARQAVKSERTQTRRKLVKTLDSDWLTVKLN